MWPTTAWVNIPVLEHKTMEIVTTPPRTRCQSITHSMMFASTQLYTWMDRDNAGQSFLSCLNKRNEEGWMSGWMSDRLTARLAHLHSEIHCICTVAFVVTNVVENWRSFSNNDDNSKGNVLGKKNLHSLKPLCNCSYLLNLSDVTQLSTSWWIHREGFKFKQRKENLLTCVYVLHKTNNLIIWRCCFARKMY